MWFVTFKEEPPNKATKVYSGIQYVFLTVSHTLFLHCLLLVVLFDQEIRKRKTKSKLCAVPVIAAHVPPVHIL